MFDCPLKVSCFDGTCNMSGTFKVVQARLKEMCPNSAFVHIANHSLDLGVTRSGKRCLPCCWYAEIRTRTAGENHRQGTRKHFHIIQRRTLSIYPHYFLTAILLYYAVHIPDKYRPASERLNNSNIKLLVKEYIH